MRSLFGEALFFVVILFDCVELSLFYFVCLVHRNVMPFNNTLFAVFLAYPC